MCIRDRPQPQPQHRPAPDQGNTWAARLRGPQAAAPVPEPRAPQPMQEVNGSSEQGIQFGSFTADQFGMHAPEPLLPPVPQQQFLPLPGAPQPSQKEQAPLPEAAVTSTSGRPGDVLRSQTQQSTIWKSLVDLWDKRELCDLKLKPEPGDVRISVHSVVIAAASVTVAQALINSRRESSTNVTPPELLVHCELSLIHI
eukprot:TRINITY_DN3258_c0_g1_i3.p1 TRINITY_DN3258_c0_g1~~TRINITY_DN3258_c0_g1_i3.p1  ORF type:complete len:198 (+),score=70.59 TRINITY_DN3258_c0_g1_i3:136-729(+)